MRSRGEAASALWALAAQAINFLVILAPVLLGRLDAIAVLVFAGAIGGIAAHTFTWSFSSVYPGLIERAERVRAVASSAAGLIVATIALAIVGAVSRADWGSTLLVASVLCLAQGAYILATSVLVQQGDHRRFAATRIGYALANGLFTTAFLMLPGFVPGLALAAAASYVVGALVASAGRLGGAAISVRQANPTAREIFQFAHTNWAATLASLLGGLAAQTSSLATPFVAPFSGQWAGVVRIASGFAGTSHQVLAPIFEMRLSQRLREPSLSTGRIYLSATGTGIALSLVAYLGIVGVFLLSALISPDAEIPATSIFVIAAVYALGLLTPTVAGKFLVMAGHQRSQLVISAAKVVATALAVFLFTGLGLLAALAVIEVAFAISYTALLLSSIRKNPGVSEEIAND